MLSTMPCLSRHWKNASRASQHFCRSVLDGASKAPSEDGFGGDGDVSDEENGQILGITFAQ